MRQEFKSNLGFMLDQRNFLYNGMRNNFIETIVISSLKYTMSNVS